MYEHSRLYNGWVNYANEPIEKRRLSGPARTLVTSLGWRAARRLCGQSTTWRVRSNFFNKIILIYLLIFTSVAYDPQGWQKLDQSQNSTKLYSTLLIYLFIIWIFKTFRPAGCTSGCRVKMDLEPIAWNNLPFVYFHYDSLSLNMFKCNLKVHFSENKMSSSSPLSHTC